VLFSISAATSIVSSFGLTTHTGLSTSGLLAPTNSTTRSTHRRFERRALDIKPIRTKADYRAALEDVKSLMTAKENTPEGDRLDVLATLIEAYERAHFPMDLPDAVDAIKFRMEQSGLTVEDLEPVIGRKNRVYEVLSRRRTLTLRMIEGLHSKFGIPAESLLKQRATRVPASRAKRP